MTESREIRIYKDLMGANERWAREIRVLRDKHGLLLLNLIGSPGSGKTALLEASVPRLREHARFAVLEGDVETTRDAERLHALGVQVSQLLSGGACHLEAKLVHRALRDLPLDALDIVFVENVGNMVCPAEFDIGEHAKVAVLSVTEGEEKPLKYPLLFREAQAVVVTKIDLLPHLDYDLAACRRNIETVNGSIPVFEVSTRHPESLGGWIDWLCSRRASPTGTASAGTQAAGPA